MPSRNRAREIAKFGEVKQYVGSPPNKQTVVVGPEDLRRLSAGTRWLFSYLDRIFERNEPNYPMLRQSSNEVLSWHLTKVGHDKREFTATSSGLQAGFYPDASSPARVWYNPGDGFKFAMRRSLESGAGEESIRLSLVDHRIVAGAYRYFDYATPDEAPAPDADFASIEEAHHQTVSGRLGVLLGSFREMVSDPTDPIYLTHYGRKLPHRPPSELL